MPKGLWDPLPVPRQQDVFDTSFAQEEAQRQEKIQQLLYEWHKTYSEDESRLDKELGRQQKEQAEDARVGEARRTRLFADDQEQRVEGFWEGERLRGKKFEEKEDKRAQIFNNFLHQWQADIDDVQRRALPEAHNRDNEQTKKVKGFTTSLRNGFDKQLSSWKDALERNQRMRNRLLSKSTVV